MFNTITNKELYAQLSEHVYGHDKAKKALINLINRSKTRYYQKYVLGEDCPLTPAVCLLIGASGTGKTYLVEILAKVCNFPLIKVNATQLCPVGNKDGVNINQLKAKIHSLAHTLYTEQKHQTTDMYFSKEGIMAQTIVYIDEIDKLAKAVESSGEWNNHIQATLLSLLENKEDFDGISFILSGAFTGMEADKTSKSIGFCKDTFNNNTHSDQVSALIKYGLISEFVGRITNIVSLDTLTIKDYTRILKDIMVPHAMKELRAFNIHNITLSQEEIERIALSAFNGSTGIRGMRRELSQWSQDLEFNYEEQTHEEQQPCIEMSR